MKHSNKEQSKLGVSSGWITAESLQFKKPFIPKPPKFNPKDTIALKAEYFHKVFYCIVKIEKVVITADGVEYFDHLDTKYTEELLTTKQISFEEAFKMLEEERDRQIDEILDGFKSKVEELRNARCKE